MPSPSARLRTSVLLTLTSALLTASCASAPPPEPVVVVVPPSTPPVATTKTAEEPSEPSWAELEVEVETINARLRIVTPDGPEQSVELEPSGRVVKRVTEDRYEEDFYLKDVIRVEYVREPDWPNPHVARVFLRKNGITRWHRGDDEWTISTIPHVSFVFAEKLAADDVVAAFRILAKR